MSTLSLPPKIPDITDRPSFIDSLKEVLQFCADIGAEYIYYNVFQTYPSSAAKARCAKQERDAVNVDEIKLARKETAISDDNLLVARRISALHKPATEEEYFDAEGQGESSDGVAKKPQTPPTTLKSSDLIKLPADARGDDELQKAIFKYMKAALRKHHPLVLDAADPGEAKAGEIALRLARARLAPHNDFDVINDAKKAYSNHLSAYNGQDVCAWFDQALQLKRVLRHYAQRDSEPSNVLEDCIAEIKTSEGRESLLTMQIQGWESMNALAGKSTSSPESILAFQRLLDKFDTLGKQLRARKADASTFCAWCFRELGGKKFKHPEAQCTNKLDPEAAKARHGMGGRRDSGNRQDTRGKACALCGDRGCPGAARTERCDMLNELKEFAKSRRAEDKQRAARARAAEGGDNETGGARAATEAYSPVRLDMLSHLAVSTLAPSLLPKPTRTPSPPPPMDTLVKHRHSPYWRARNVSSENERLGVDEPGFQIPRLVPGKKRGRSRAPSPERESRGAHIRSRLQGKIREVTARHESLFKQQLRDAIRHLTERDGDWEMHPDARDLLKCNKARYNYGLSVTRSEIDSAASACMSNNRALAKNIRPSPGTTIECAKNGSSIDSGVEIGDLNVHGLPTVPIYLSDELSSTLLSVPALVSSGNMDLVHSQTHGHFMQPATEACPICTPHPARVSFQSTPQDITLDIMSDANGSYVRHEPLAAHLSVHKPLSTSASADPAPAPTVTTAPATTPTSDTSVPAQAQDEASPPSTSELAQQCTRKLAPHVYTQLLQLLGLWHARLGGVGPERFLAFVQAYPAHFPLPKGVCLNDLRHILQLCKCHCCHRSGIKRHNAPPAVTRTVKPLEEIHMDLFFFDDTPTLLLIDRGSRAKFSYTLGSKAELPRAFLQFIIDINTCEYAVASMTYTLKTSNTSIDALAVNAYLADHNCTQRVKIIYSDNAAESESALAEEIYLLLQIQHNKSIVECQYQNGLAESQGWHALNATRHDLDLAHLGKQFAKYSFSLNLQRSNMMPHPALDGKSPHSILFPNKPPPIHLLKPFGCQATFLNQEKSRRDKLIARGTQGIYLGTALPFKQSGYLIYVPASRQLVTTAEAKFDEHFFPARKHNQRILDFFSTSPGTVNQEFISHSLRGDDTLPGHAAPTPLRPAPSPAQAAAAEGDATDDEDDDGTPDLIPESDAEDDDEAAPNLTPNSVEAPALTPGNAPATLTPPRPAITPTAEPTHAPAARPSDVHTFVDPSVYFDEYEPEDSDTHSEPTPPAEPSPHATRSGHIFAHSTIHTHDTPAARRPAHSGPASSFASPSRRTLKAHRAIAALQRAHDNGLASELETLNTILHDLECELPTPPAPNLHASRAISDARHGRPPTATPAAKPAMDAVSGELIDLTDYHSIHHSELTSSGSLSTQCAARLLIRALKAYAKDHPEQRATAAKEVALLRNPKTVKEALSTPQRAEWLAAINKEMQSLIDKGVYRVEDVPAGRKLIPTRLVLKIKLNADGSIDKFKARCVVAGYRQKAGLDYDPMGTYSPMTESTTIRLLLSLANMLNLEVDHLDIKTAFLNGVLPESEQFYCSPPPGFSLEPGKGWKMLKGLYGAHQSGAVWAKTWREWMKQHYPHFHEAGTERCVYVMREAADGTPLDLSLARDIQLEPGERLVILIMNTDDLLVLYNESARSIVDDFEKHLNTHFEATPRAPVEQYLGMHVSRDRTRRTLALDGRRHVYDFIWHMGMDPQNGTPVRTPLDPHTTYSKSDCPDEIDTALRDRVWKAHGKLIHLSVWCRPDLCHAVSVLGRYVHNPSQKLWEAYRRITKYLIKTKDLRLVYGSADPAGGLSPYGTSDSDWGASLDDRRSTGAYIFFLDGAGISWKVKLSPTACLSTQEAEYIALSEATKEALNLRMLLRDLGFGLSAPMTLFSDNKGAISMSQHPTNKPATRHVDMRIHMCRQHVELGNIKTEHMSGTDLPADMCSKQTVCPTHEKHTARTFGDQSIAPPAAPITRIVHGD